MLFIKTIFTMFVAEMGDKTQFLLIAMASKYRLKHILVGTAAGVLILNGLAVCIGSMLNNVLPVLAIKLGAGIAFLCFAFFTLSANGEEEEHDRKGTMPKSPALSVFLTFFIAELGDKTQLTALTFAASEGTHHALTVFVACSAGLFIADMIGLCIGYFLKTKLPNRLISMLTYGIFTIFGLVTVHEALHIFHLNDLQRTLLTIAVSMIFGLISLSRLPKIKKLRDPIYGKRFKHKEKKNI